MLLSRSHARRSCAVVMLAVIAILGSLQGVGWAIDPVGEVESVGEVVTETTEGTPVEATVETVEESSGEVTAAVATTAETVEQAAAEAAPETTEVVQTTQETATTASEATGSVVSEPTATTVKASTSSAPVESSPSTAAETSDTAPSSSSTTDTASSGTASSTSSTSSTATSRSSSSSDPARNAPQTLVGSDDPRSSGTVFALSKKNKNKRGETGNDPSGIEVVEQLVQAGEAIEGPPDLPGLGIEQQESQIVASNPGALALTGLDLVLPIGLTALMILTGVSILLWQSRSQLVPLITALTAVL